MIASVHLVDRGVRSTLRSLGLAPQPDETPGLREARTVIAAPLGGRVPAPQFGRLGLVAFWEDDAAADAFLVGDHPLVERLAGGWSARLRASSRSRSRATCPAARTTARATGRSWC